ncbi:hypothetical protein H4P12_17830 [Paracoccus sp. 11-3]|uniref:Secreted protein n=1 Tax=Paracoccus amoyensis TaxID=2760093 RepID=A0A926GRF7_9RHOB|nr:hypothetical protein [Paracoccus amoyensis]MBC9248525.1 hypothetical protein [Paracoccus amoyensis]
MSRECEVFHDARLKGIALVAAILLSPFAHPAEAASCASSPTICTEGDGRFLFGTAEIEGWVDATAIGMSARERYHLTFHSYGVSEGGIYSESAFATLDMNQSGNTVGNNGNGMTYDGGSSNAINAAGPYSDRFAGGVSLVPSLTFPGQIINDYSLAMMDLDIRARQGVLWPETLPARAPTASVGSFNLSIGFFGLDIDPVDPHFYDVDQDNHVRLTTSNFDRLLFTFSDGEGGTTTRELTMPSAVPLPASAVFLLACLSGFFLLRSRQLATAQARQRVAG